LRRTLVLAGAVAAAVLLGGCGHTTPITSGTATPAPPFKPLVSNEYPIPTANSKPAGITTTSTALWFTEELGNKIGTIGSSATITEYPVPTANAEPLNIVVGIDGNLWFTEFAAAQIGRVTTSGASFVECALPPQNGGPKPTPFGIAAGPDGALYVTDPASNGIWRVTTGCTASFYSLATANAGPESITVGPNGALWFVETNVDKVAELVPGAPAGTVPSEFPVSTGAGLGVIVSGSDNALWFTETKTAKLGRMLTTGALASETPLTGVQTPYGLTLAPNGNFYIGDQTGSTIAQYVTTTGVTTTYPTKSPNAGPFWLTIGFDRQVYFTAQNANTIGQFKYF
jgi:virginiamycin B lyase